MKVRKLPLWLVVLLLLSTLQAAPAHASVWGRVKDIYNAPEKVDELVNQYEQTQQQLDEQKRKAEDAEAKLQSYLEEQQKLLEQNEAFRKKNEELAQQNADLLQEVTKLEHDRSERSKWLRKGAFLVGGAALLVLGYLLSIRVWRYAVWRRQKQHGGVDER